MNEDENKPTDGKLTDCKSNSISKGSPAEKKSEGCGGSCSNQGEGSCADRAVDEEASRRTFFSTCGNLAMAGGLAASYGTLGYCGLKFLSPETEDSNLGWQFVGTLDSLKGVDSYEYTASSGVKIVLARAADFSGAAEAPEAPESPGSAESPESAESGFLALSSVCPHLGCQVFWETANDRFFCPCHNGVFDAAGKATGGPPADANQSLTQYPTKVLNDALYVKAPLKTVTDSGRKA